jgi:hypothetical protein
MSFPSFGLRAGGEGHKNELRNELTFGHTHHEDLGT